MRCTTCDKRLTPSECVQKHAHTGEYLDMCNKCLDGLGIPIQGDEDAMTEVDGDVEIDEVYNEDCINYERDVVDEWDNT